MLPTRCEHKRRPAAGGWLPLNLMIIYPSHPPLRSHEVSTSPQPCPHPVATAEMAAAEAQALKPSLRFNYTCRCCMNDKNCSCSQCSHQQDRSAAPQPSPLGRGPAERQTRRWPPLPSLQADSVHRCAATDCLAHALTWKGAAVISQPAGWLRAPAAAAHLAACLSTWQVGARPGYRAPSPAI